MRTQNENKQKAQSAGNAGDQVVAGCSFASDWLCVRYRLNNIYTHARRAWFHKLASHVKEL